jgi:hypothetical protein
MVGCLDSTGRRRARGVVAAGVRSGGGLGHRARILPRALAWIILAAATNVESAQVFFDYNPPVQTGTVVRTIEAAPPSVAVQALPATVPAGPVQLSWQGGDGGSMNGAP